MKVLAIALSGYVLMSVCALMYVVHTLRTLTLAQVKWWQLLLLPIAFVVEWVSMGLLWHRRNDDDMQRLFAPCNLCTAAFFIMFACVG